MIATVKNFSDSLGVQFPTSLFRDVTISGNEDIEHITTKERIAAFCEPIDKFQSEIDWGKPQGNEIW